MRRTVSTAALALPLALATPAVQATGISMNNVPMPGVPLETCLARGSSALAGAGLTLLNRTSEAAWAEFPGTGQIFTVYCLTRSGVAVVIGAADRAEIADPTVTRVLQALGGGPVGAIPRPGTGVGPLK